MEISNRAPAWGYCLNDLNNVSFVIANLHSCKTIESYKNVPGHFDGCVLLFHYVWACEDGFAYVKYGDLDIINLVDENVLF